MACFGGGRDHGRAAISNGAGVSHVDRKKQSRKIDRGDAKACGVPVLCTFLPLLGLINFSFDPGSSMEGDLRWEATVRWMEGALPLLQHGVALLVCYWVAVLLPMSIFRRMHPLIASALRISSLLIGGVCWWQSCIVTFRLLGWLAVAIGLLLAGVGVVPMALFATAVKGDWIVFGEILAGVFLTVIPRLIAKFMTNRTARMNAATRPKTYYAGSYDV